VKCLGYKIRKKTARKQLEKDKKYLFLRYSWFQIFLKQFINYSIAQTFYSRMLLPRLSKNIVPL
jgi:hypothetical protein